MNVSLHNQPQSLQFHHICYKYILHKHHIHYIAYIATFYGFHSLKHPHLRTSSLLKVFESQLTIVAAVIMHNNTTQMLANDFISQYPNSCRAQLLSLLFCMIMIIEREKKPLTYHSIGLTSSKIISFYIKKIFGKFYQSFVCKTQMFLQVLLDSIVVYLSSLVVLDEQIDIFEFAS